MFKNDITKIPVRGIVSNADYKLIEEYNKYNSKESPNLNLKFYTKGHNWEEFAHQKLIVIDGLIAFKGSANFTKNGWRKTLEYKDKIEYLTTINDVVELNNDYFSREWASFSNRKSMVINIKDPYGLGL